jgi:hypothetical protein
LLANASLSGRPKLSQAKNLAPTFQPSRRPIFSTGTKGFIFFPTLTTARDECLTFRRYAKSSLLRAEAATTSHSQPSPCLTLSIASDDLFFSTGTKDFIFFSNVDDAT